MFKQCHQILNGQTLNTPVNVCVCSKSGNECWQLERVLFWH